MNVLIKLTPNSTTIASTMLPITVTKSNVFHGSLKKFYNFKTTVLDKRLYKLDVLLFVLKKLKLCL